MRKTAEIIISGHVQAVGYRLFAKRIADNLGLTGYVRNLSDGTVKIVASGPDINFTSFIEKLSEGPRKAIVQDIRVSWRKDETYAQFNIVY